MNTKNIYKFVTLQRSGQKNLKCVKAFSVTPSGDYEKWAIKFSE